MKNESEREKKKARADVVFRQHLCEHSTHHNHATLKLDINLTTLFKQRHQFNIAILIRIVTYVFRRFLYLFRFFFANKRLKESVFCVISSRNHLNCAEQNPNQVRQTMCIDQFRVHFFPSPKLKKIMNSIKRSLNRYNSLQKIRDFPNSSFS